MSNNKKKLLYIYLSIPMILILLGILFIIYDNRISNVLTSLFSDNNGKLGASITYSCPSGYVLSGTYCYKCQSGATFNSINKKCYTNAGYDSNYCPGGTFYHKNMYTGTNGACLLKDDQPAYKGHINISALKAEDCGSSTTEVSYIFVYDNVKRCYVKVQNPGGYTKCDSGTYSASKPGGSAGNYCMIDPIEIKNATQKTEETTNETVTITLYLLGGTFNNNSSSNYKIQMTKGTKLRTLPTPTRSGYIFKGWYTAESGGSKISTGTTVSSDVSYYAQWEEETTNETVTITLYLLGGTFNNNNSSSNYKIQMTKGTELRTLPTPTRSGYIFKGWYTAESGGSKISTGTIVSSDVSYYAQWTAKKFTVTYCSDISCSSKKTSSATYGSRYNILAYTTFSKTGYTNKKWKEVKNGTNIYWTVENTNNKGWIWNYTYNVTLYATWSPITYTLVFNKNNIDATGTMSNQTMTYDVKTTINANKFTYKGRNFAGWNLKADGSGKSYSNSQNVVNFATKQGAKVTLYAQWTPITYTIKFNSNGGTGTMNSMAKTFNVPKSAPESAFTKKGYFFNGWNTKADGSGTSYSTGQNIGNLTAVQGNTAVLYAQWVDENSKLELAGGKYIIRKLNDTPKVMKNIKVYKNAKMYDNNKEMNENSKFKTGNKVTLEGNEYTVAVSGDVTSDGNITFEDVFSCYYYFKTKSAEKNEHYYAADMNRDNQVEFEDVFNIYQALKGDGD